MNYNYDLLVIGLGPAGMAVAVMGSEMGLKVCAIEKHKIGGECMNVGCIPSKALLKIAEMRHSVRNFEKMELGACGDPSVRGVFSKIQKDIRFINENKTTGMFKKVDLILGQGFASFVDPHMVTVGNRTISAKRIFICTGTKPGIPPIPGIESIEVLTNETIFSIDEVPESLLIIGGGAIGCEMAQAFSRLGSRVTVVHMDAHLLPFGDKESGDLIEKVFAGEGIKVVNGRLLTGAEAVDGKIVLTTDKGEKLTGQRLLVATGRRMALDELKLEAAGVETTKRGIVVNRYLQTTQPHIYAVGDCNGHYLLSHAAMHQGMLALINCMLPKFLKRNFRRFVVPWTVFTEPQVSHVGLTRRELEAAGKKFEEVSVSYDDYGAAIAEGINTGHVRAFISPTGRIYGAQIVGAGSGEMINEWGLAIQKKIRITDIMFLQHSFPTMSFLTKRLSETWMMNRMKSPWIRRMIRWMY